MSKHKLQLFHQVEREDDDAPDAPEFTFRIERRGMDVEERTFPVVLSSDAPVDRDIRIPGLH